MNPIISFQNVSKIYSPPGETALRDVDFSITAGEFVCLVGESGGGKTTILKIIAGLEKETAGTVTKPENVSVVFQSGAVLPWLSVFDNIALPLLVKKMPRKEIKKICDEQIKIIGLSGFADKLPSELSGGQRQRVGIARALATNPDVLLLDEPFSALDAKTTSELHTDLIKIWKDTGKTVVMVSHLIEEAVSLSSKIMLIKNKTVTHQFSINFPYPRREQQEAFMSEVSKIRKEFFN